MGILDVTANALIDKAAENLAKKIEKPAWADYIKSSVNREKAPDRRDWLYVRMGSILYRLYVDGPQGVGSLRTYYGGKQRRGRQRPHFKKASGKAIRFCMQALEKEGLIEKAKPKGRKLSPKGQAFLDKMSKDAKESMPKIVHEVKSQIAGEAKPEEKKHDKYAVQAEHAKAGHIKHEEKKPEEKKPEHAKPAEKKEEHHAAQKETKKEAEIPKSGED